MGTGVSVKAHKSAENCIRLLRKKQNAQGRPPCVILVSWANAGALLPFLNECTNINAKVIVLCESASRKKDGLDSLASRYPFVEKVVFQWADAVQAVGLAVAEMQWLSAERGRQSMQPVLHYMLTFSFDHI